MSALVPASASVRPATPDEIPYVARLWHDAWHETQAGSLPQELIDLRTLDDFERRLIDMGDDLRVFSADDAPIAFCAIRHHAAETPGRGTGELYQLFAHPSARGTGAAAALMTDAEARLRAYGHRRAHLSCLDDNPRALRFYGRCGWTNTGVEPVMLDTSKGPMAVPCAVLIKDLEATS